MAVPQSAAAAELVQARPLSLALSERKLLRLAGDSTAVATAFLLAFNLRTAEVRHIGLAVPRVALGIVLDVFLVSAYLADAYRLAGAVNLRGTFRGTGLWYSMPLSWTARRSLSRSWIRGTTWSIRRIPGL
jgi:hypothetical protein